MKKKERGAGSEKKCVRVYRDDVGRGTTLFIFVISFSFFVFCYAFFVLRWRRSAPLLALRAQAPVDDFGFVDLKAVMGLSLEAGGVANCAANVFGVPAGAADEVMMIVADAIFVARCGICRLDTADDAFFS